MSEQLPQKNFDDFYLSDGMLSTLAEIGYKTPTPVQEASIPLVMAGIDLIVQAQTGTGKTAAFAIPIAEMLSYNPGTVEVLVLAPTRELARQVSEEFATLVAHRNIDVATIYGGTGYEPQYRALETAQIVVATPGRLLDLANSGKCDLSKLQIFGLDEADEMLSMGFAEEVDAIINHLPEERQSLLFSATITSEIRALGKRMLYYPEFLTLSSDSVAATEVTHEWFSVTGVGRARDLLRVLEYEEPDNAIIFANTKADTFQVTNFLKRHGLAAAVLNGDLPQKERERTLKALKDEKVKYLVATDVAARGIDISGLSHVINYVIPESAEVYVHRTGRTGRAGLKGNALSLISPAEMATLFNVRKLYEIEMIKRALPTGADILTAKKKRHLENLHKRIEAVNVPYGGAIGLARSLMNGASQNEDNVRLVAQLIAVAERVARGETPQVPASLAQIEVEAETVETVEAVEAVEAVEVEAVETAEPRAEAQTSDVVEEETESRQDRRGAKEPDERKARSADDRSGDGRRRRRRRRSSDDDQKPESKPEEKQAAAEDNEGSGRSRRSRRRRGGSGRRSGNKRSGKQESGDSRSGNKKAGTRSGRSSGSSRNRSNRGSNKSEHSRDERSSKPATPATPEHDMSKMWVNVGKNHFEASEQIVEMVCFMAGMDPEDLGSITLENSYSYVEVRDDYFYDIINAMNNQDWNGIKVSAEPARK